MEQIDKLKEEFDKEFGPKTIWVVPSKENIETIKDIWSWIIQNFTPKQEDKKECKHEFIGSFDDIGKVSEFCCKCGKQNPKCGIRWDIPRLNPTPSPLDSIEEVEELWKDTPYLQTSSDRAINSLIRNQTKIINYLKNNYEKK